MPGDPVFTLRDLAARDFPGTPLAVLGHPIDHSLSPPMHRAALAALARRDRRFEGWVGFISPVAEFTPKIVQTDELRSTLVYEVRVFVKDPKDELRLGMPATVYLAQEQNAKATPNVPSEPGG